MNRSVAYLAPPILQSESKKYSFFAPINIYDSLLLGSEPFKIILQVISGTKREMMTPKQYMTSFESGPRFAEAKKLLKLALNQTYIAVNKTHGVRNYSPDEFEPGSSISHLEKVNENGPEFLMVPSIAKGITLSALKKKFNMTTAYGPETKAIMEKLGYSTSDNPNELKLNISLTFGSDNYKPSFEYKSNRSMSQPSLGPKSKRPSKKRKTKKPSSSNFMDTLKGLVGKSKSASSGIRHSTLLSTVTLAWIFFNTI